MKEKIINILSVVGCIVLLIIALCIGAVGGWRDEKETLYASAPEMGQALQNRAMDAANLAVVAARHVTDTDPSVMALREAFELLQRNDLTMQQLLDADKALANAVADLAQRLPALPSMQASARDTAYLTALTRTLSVDSGLDTVLTEAQEAFDKRLSSSLTGRIAMLFGVRPFHEDVGLPPATIVPVEEVAP